MARNEKQILKDVEDRLIGVERTVNAIYELVRDKTPHVCGPVAIGYSGVRIANGYEFTGVFQVMNITLHDTDAPSRYRVVGIDAEGHSTGALPEGSTVNADSSDPDVISASVEGSTVVLDPNGPAIGTATVTVSVRLPDGTALPDKTHTVSVLAGTPVDTDLELEAPEGGGTV